MDISTSSTSGPNTGCSEIYAWAGVRAIVCRYILNPEQYQWLTDAPGLRSVTDFSAGVLKQMLDDIEGIVANSPLKSKINSAAFRQQLTNWLSEQYQTQHQPQLERPVGQAETTGAPIHDSCNDVDAGAATTAAPAASVATVLSDDIQEAATARQNDTSSSLDLCKLRGDLASDSLPNVVPTFQDQQTPARGAIDKPEKKHAAGAEISVQRRPLPAARVIQQDSSGVD